jgi:outer membrane protein assembly factor BamB
MKSLLFTRCLLFTLCLRPVLLPAGDWPRFMGPNADNICTETGLNWDWPEGGPPRLWSLDCGESYSAPAIRDGKVIHFDRLKDQAVVGCFDAVSGVSQWTYAYPTAYRDRYGYNNGPRSTPTIDGERVYAYGADGVLSCLDFATGKKIWERRMNDEMPAPPDNFFGNGLPAVIEGDTILLNVGGYEKGWILGLDKLSGKTRWQFDTLGASYSACVVKPFGGKRYALVLSREGLFVVDPATGKRKFQPHYPFRSRLRDSVNSASPVVVGDTIFLSATYGTGAALLQFTGDRLVQKWRDVDAMQNHWSTSIHDGGYYYGCSGRHQSEATIRCIEAATGKVAWENSSREFGRATLLKVEGHFVTLGERGELGLIEVNPGKYVLKHKIEPETLGLRPPCWAPPVIANGLLYIRSERRFLCLDLRKKTE